MFQEPGISEWAAAVLLVLATVAAAWLSRDGPRSDVPRLAGAFVLALWAAGPSGSAVVATIAGTAVDPSGVFGPPSPSRSDRGAAWIAVLGLELGALWIEPGGIVGPGATLARICLGWVAVVAMSSTVALGWSTVRHGLPAAERLALGRSPVAESIAVPGSVVLVSAWPPGGSMLSLAAGAFLVLGTAWALRQRHRENRATRAVRENLDLRLGELASLHALGREMASSFDIPRLCSILDREIRKMTHAERVAVALTEPVAGRLRWAWRSDGRTPANRRPEPVTAGLETAAVVERRILRPSPPAVAAVLPMMVGQHAVGMLRVDFPSGTELDEPVVSFLSTLAQSSAVAIEGARRHRSSTIDSLTGLLLRDEFFRRAEQEHARAERYHGTYTVAMLDLDGFKSINDRHGHVDGDHVLAAVGQEVRRAMRTADLASRYGGDEICILLPETGSDGGSAIAERLRVAISRLPVDTEGAVVRVTVSIGLATYPEHGTTGLAEILRRADRALYDAKRQGRDRVASYTGPVEAGPRPGAPFPAGG